MTNHYEFVDHNWCPDCGERGDLCTCAPELPFAGYVDLNDEPDPDCFFCGGTGLAPNGWDDCPECMPVYDEDGS